MRQRYPMSGTQALFSALGGQTRQGAMDAELDRLTRLDLSRSQMGLHDAQAHAAREKTRLDRDAFDSEERRRNLRMDPTFLSQLTSLRLPEIPPADISRVVRRGLGGPFELPPGINPMQLRLAGETLSSMVAGAAADAPTDAAKMAGVVTGAGSSAQRLRAPELATEDPITAAFMLNAGTDKAAPALYGALPSGLGTFGTLTGATNYDAGMKGAAISKSDAEAAKHRAAAAQSYAAAGASNASAAKTRQDMDRYVDPDRGGATDLRTGVFTPWTIVGGQPIGPKSSASNGKSLPVSALKLQQEGLEAIGIASAIDADLAEFERQIEAGDLKLGPVQNPLSWSQNWSGMSTPNSRNYQSFSSTLEKLRNDSLRLNKGVQTEGDAQRAWNELVANKNDPKVVKQRLAEIRAINRRAAELQKHNIEVLRQNYGVEPLDTTPQSSVGAAVGAGSPVVSHPAPGVPPQVHSAADYEAIPPGAEYLDPNGLLRRKAQ